MTSRQSYVYDPKTNCERARTRELKLIPSAQLVGVDLEYSILQVAKENLPDAQAGRFVASDIFNLALRQECFDLVVCQYVLQHLNQPVQALEEMRRVSRPGGWAIIFESDDRAGFSYPPLPRELQELFEARIALVERKGGDRSIGRKSYHLRLAGWTGIEVKIVSDVWQGPAQRKNALESAYLSFTQLKPQLIAENLISDHRQLWQFLLALAQRSCL